MLMQLVITTMVDLHVLASMDSEAMALHAKVNDFKGYLYLQTNKNN